MANCANTDCGALALDVPGGGGLYGNESNERPDWLTTRIAEAVDRLPPRGSPIGFVGLGMSNADRVWQPFVQQCGSDPTVNGGLRFVDGCFYGWTLDQMANDLHPHWTNSIPSATAAAKVKPEDVRVAWVMAGLKDGHFGVQEQVAMWRQTLAIACSKFPRLEIAYLESPQYMGYASSGLAPKEPFYRESGAAIRTVLIDQEQKQLPVVGSWGRYFWTNGPTPNGWLFSWRCPVDCIADGIHQSSYGARRMASALISYLRVDEGSEKWFLS